MVHSSLFRACNQTRAEGLALFYQHHVFVLYVEHGGCFLAILLWLHNIGDVGRKNIRHLHIHFEAICVPQDRSSMEKVHQRLSDRATVVYFARFGVLSLWNIGLRCHNTNAGKELLFRFETHIERRSLQMLDVDDEDLQEFANLSCDDPDSVCSIVFPPGQSWFGSRTTSVYSHSSSHR